MVFTTTFLKVSEEFPLIPPYNIKEKDDLGVIEFAVAGFTEKDLKVEVKDQTLHVYGCKEEKKIQRTFFTKEYRIELSKKSSNFMNTLVINGAELKDGLLKVAYHRDIPESEKPKVIEIKSKK